VPNAVEPPFKTEEAVIGEGTNDPSDFFAPVRFNGESAEDMCPFGGPIQSDHTHWCADYEGEDRDARLDNALAAAADGDRIMLERGSYEADRTFDKEVTIYGYVRAASSSSPFDSGTQLFGEWETSNSHIHFIGLVIRSVEDANLILGNSYTSASFLYLRGEGTVL